LSSGALFTVPFITLNFHESCIPSLIAIQRDTHFCDPARNKKSSHSYRPPPKKGKKPVEINLLKTTGINMLNNYELPKAAKKKLDEEKLKKLNII